MGRQKQTASLEPPYVEIPPSPLQITISNFTNSEVQMPLTDNVLETLQLPNNQGPGRPS